MSQGSVNEIPTADHFATFEWVLEFYDVGLLEWKEAAYIAVSPDGIVRIKVQYLPFRESEPQLACLEIKTRVSENTINVTEEAARKYGRLVYCTFDDEKFKICVPASNRKQIIHQALVTGLKYGVFVVAKVEEGEGSLIQTVVVKILDDQKEAHATPLKTIGKALLGWIYDPNLLSKGYLLARDCPKWMTMMQQHNCVFRYKLWAAHYNRVKGDGECYKPTYPVSMYKHSQQ